MSITTKKYNLIPVRRDGQATLISAFGGGGGGVAALIGGGGGGSGATYDDSGIKSQLSTETSNRISGDASLSTSLSTETSNRITKDNSLSTDISTEVSVRTSQSFLYLKLTGGTMTGDVSYTTGSDIQSETYVSGYAGTGFKLDNSSENTLEVDNLKVRNKLSAYELEINEINSIGGGLIISPANGVSINISDRLDGSYYIYFDEDNGDNQIQFTTNDYVKAQIWTGSGIGSYLGQVISVNHSNSYGSAYIWTTTISGTPWKGMKLVQHGNSSDTSRQSLIYLTSSDTNAPYLDMCSGINNGSLSGKQVLRLGKLDGISDPDFGTLSGPGLYATNVFLKGKIQISSGSVGYSNISDKPTTLSAVDSTAASKLNGIEAGATVGATSAQVSAINTAQLLAQATSYGKMLYRDPTFISSNQAAIYNNNGNGSVSMSLTNQTDSPNYGTSGRDLTITYNGTEANPGYGGFCFATQSRANAVFVTKIIAKIPVGRTINFASNAIGNNSVQQWLTSQNGTGRFTEYISYLKCGDSGSFSSTNYFYLDGGSNVAFTWYVSFSTVYDLTDTDVTYINAAATTATWAGVSGAGKPQDNANYTTNTNQLTDGANLGGTATWGGISSKPVRFADTPQGAGLCMTASYLGYYDGGAWKSYIDNSGNCKFVGIAELGTQTADYGGKVSSIAIKNADIYEGSYNGDDSILWLNRIGYAGGTSRFRNTAIGNGKGSSIAVFNNSECNMWTYYRCNKGLLVGACDVAGENYGYAGQFHGNAYVTGTFSCSNAITATNFLLSSDSRLKENIKSLDSNEINIEYKQFNLTNDPNQIRYGVIAQELQKTHPELIRTDNKGMLSVAYIDLLIKEIHYLKSRVNELENKLK